MTGYIKEELEFKHLPGFSRFVVDHKLAEFAHMQATLSRELDLPLLKFYAHVPEQELVELGKKSATEFLLYLADNRAGSQLQTAISEWINNQLKYVTQEQVQIDDLLLVSYIRKRAFTSLLKFYTTDIDLLEQLHDELDRFFIAYDRSTTSIYVQFLKNRIAEDIYFREKLAGTSPGFNYIYDIGDKRQLQPYYKLFDYLGYSKSEYQNEDFFARIIHPEDTQAALPYLEKIKKSADGEVFFFEYRLLAKNQAYKWMRNYESIYKRDENRDVRQLIGVAFDISEERSIRDELLARKEELLEAQELTNMGNFTWYIESGEIAASPQTRRILGLQQGDQMDQFLQKVHPADRPVVKEAIENALQGKGDFEAEYRFEVSNNEKIIWGKGKVNIENGRPLFMKGTVMDVTDKHHMVQKLTRSESLYKHAQALNKLGNWTWEIKTDKLEWSDELYRIYGMEPHQEKVDFERFISFIHPEDREERIKKLQAQMTLHQLQDYHFRIIANDGTEKILYGQSRVLVDENGIPFKMIGTCQDVTKQKELENTLLQKTIQLERSNASLQDFAFLSSHDLKEPLRKISVFGDKLRISQQNNPDPQSLYALNKIVDSAKKMQQMVDELLSLSRITADHAFSCCNLQDILNDTLQSLDDKITESGAVVKCTDLPEACVNEVQFRQLFENLISNAIKFRKPGVVPVIDITHHCLSREEIAALQLDQSKRYLRMVFADNGIGFPKELSEKIFTIFQRLHRGGYEGTGIGLAICKKIAEHHNGLIYAEATEFVGANFTVVIPQ